MPKRQDVRRVVTAELQGEDSWVEYRVPRVLESEELMGLQRDDTKQALSAGNKVIADHVVEWNWVDSDGAPLAQPKDDPAVVRQLTNWEYKYLLDLILGSSAERKN